MVRSKLSGALQRRGTIFCRFHRGSDPGNFDLSEFIDCFQKDLFRRSYQKRSEKDSSRNCGDRSRSESNQKSFGKGCSQNCLEHSREAKRFFFVDFRNSGWISEVVLTVWVLPRRRKSIRAKRTRFWWQKILMAGKKILRSFIWRP